jgi:hypothetical protein
VSLRCYNVGSGEQLQYNNPSSSTLEVKG